jgi:hypothetical protein
LEQFTGAVNDGRPCFIWPIDAPQAQSRSTNSEIASDKCKTPGCRGKTSIAGDKSQISNDKTSISEGKSPIASGKTSIPSSKPPIAGANCALAKTNSYLQHALCEADQSGARWRFGLHLPRL